MSKLKAGTKIIMLKGSDSSKFCSDCESISTYYRVGDVAKLTHQDDDGDWYADFNAQGNDIVHNGGIWCVGKIFKGIGFINPPFNIMLNN